MEAIFKQANAVFIQRYATAAEWTANNPIIYPGEIGIESDTGKIKVGGTQPAAWRELGYATSDGAQVIDNLTTIYNDYRSLPIGSYNGQQLVAKTNGSLPMSVYRWMHSESTWIFVDTVKENVVYLAKRKAHLNNTLCFFDKNTEGFIDTSQRNQIIITNIDVLCESEEALSKIQEKNDGDIYIAFSAIYQAYCLYQYSQPFQSWSLLAALNDYTLYSSIQPSAAHQAPENSLWRVKFENERPIFIRQGYDQDIANQLGDISGALEELHSYAISLTGGGV